MCHHNWCFCFIESIEEPQNCVIDINGLTAKISQSVLSRDYLETRHRTVDDDGLIGLLNLLTNLIKHRPPFQISKQGQELLCEVKLLFRLSKLRIVNYLYFRYSNFYSLCRILNYVMFRNANLEDRGRQLSIYLSN